MSQRLPFKLRPQHLQAAVQRGVHFEVLYAAALRDPMSRRHLFSNAQALTRLLRGRGIVLSSGARVAMELRGPYDVINIGTTFGLTQQQVCAGSCGGRCGRVNGCACEDLLLFSPGRYQQPSLQARDAISLNCSAVLARGAARKLHAGVLGQSQALLPVQTNDGDAAGKQLTLGVNKVVGGKRLRSR